MTHNQIAFSENMRTSDHIFVMKTLIDKYARSKTPLYACFVDFRKAFDSIWRKGLLLKALQNNIRGNIFNILETMYTNTSVCVKIGNKRTDYFPTNKGVKQGDVLSPFLFNLYINDLVGKLGIDSNTPTLNKLPLNCLLYADDLVILSTSPLGLQKALDKLTEYCNTWHLQINAKKTKIMKFSAKYQNIDNQFYIDDLPIDITHKYKYLGIELSSTGSMKNTRGNIRDRALKAIFALKSRLNHTDISPKLHCKLFDQIIKPISVYGSEIWGTTLINKKDGNDFYKSFDDCPVEKLHINFCKYSLGVHKKATNSAVRGELGRFPIALSIFIQMLKFWFHMESSKNTILQHALAESKNLEHQVKKSWSSHITNLLTKTGIKIDKPSKHNIISFKNKVINDYKMYWKHSLGDVDKKEGKLSTYRHIKTSFHFENYLHDIKHKEHRIIYTSLRISSHQLAIERGRYSNPPVPREHRLCSVCNNQEVEDEKHFLIECNTYKDDRHNMIHQIGLVYPHFTNLCDTNKFLYLMTAEGKICQTVAKFCHAANKLRSVALNPQ